MDSKKFFNKKDLKAKQKQAKKEEEAKAAAGNTNTMFNPPEEEKKSADDGLDPRRFDVLQRYEFPTFDIPGGN